MTTIREALAIIHARHEHEARREAWRWSRGEPCVACGEWIGHWQGDETRPCCRLIPDNVPLQELRPGCVAVRRKRIADAIRAVTS